MEEREVAEQRSVEEVIERLTKRYPDVDRFEIERIVAQEHQAFEGRPVRDFVPVLVEEREEAREGARTNLTWESTLAPVIVLGGTDSTRMSRHSQSRSAARMVEDWGA